MRHIFFLAAPLVLAKCSAATSSATPPNIMLVVADDLGFNDVDFQEPSHSVVKTPVLKKLATSGIRLQNHHVQPFCSPTRATLMTGRFVLRYGLQNTVIWPQDAWALPLNETFLSRNLQDAGYYTAFFGKWHLGLYKKEYLPLQRGYDEQYGYYLGGEDYWTHMRNGALDWHSNDTLTINQNGSYSADLIGDVASDFIVRRAGKGPWFMYLPWQSVHSPLEAPDEYLNMYPDLTGSVKTRAAMVTAMDSNMGRVVDALNRTGQLENLVLVFTADNGAPYGDAFSAGDDPAMIEALAFSNNKTRPPGGMHGGGGGSNYPYSGWKHWVFEGGVRSAAFVYSSLLPKSIRGTVHHGLFHSVDWLPTLTGLAGASTTKNLPLDGVDIWPALLQGGTTSPRTEIPVDIAACGTKDQSIVDGPQAAMIVGDMKVIVQCWWRDSKDPSTAQLYNITADAAELHDLSAEEPALLKSVLARLDYWEGQSVDPYPKDQDNCGEGAGQGPSPFSGGLKFWDSWC
eukprot:m.789830 g.789830  ORF g.789830 m.789830 type:complete len:513 (+) comp23325_c0_seq6:97-1635(+)